MIRDLGLVKGGKGLRHHEVVLDLSWRGALQFAKSVLSAKSVLRPRTDWPEASVQESASEPVLAAQVGSASRR
ncbi:hypothetical protein [Bradyrhizobium sp.]|uniref:hypothetical protein n=1 Tax=Bradyrhizobium sp. TaxID=376 RepID=UPI001DDEFA4F|nr:hypothetical protein [Bradyrhizobium sp.]MBI5319459.1 hypothetical protein [Bradyrhizobium sp.]